MVNENRLLLCFGILGVILCCVERGCGREPFGTNWEDVDPTYGERHRDITEGGGGFDGGEKSEDSKYEKEKRDALNDALADVLGSAAGKLKDAGVRALKEAALRKLGIERGKHDEDKDKKGYYYGDETHYDTSTYVVWWMMIILLGVGVALCVWCVFVRHLFSNFAILVVALLVGYFFYITFLFPYWHESVHAD